MMSKKVTKTIVLILGALLGSFAASLTKGISWLSWLSFGGAFGVSTASPFVLDIGVIQLTFGLTFHLTVGVILGFIAAIFISRKR